MKANIALKALLYGFGFLASGAYAQTTVAFNSIPTNNACPYPWAITLTPNKKCTPVTIAPQDAKTLSCTFIGATTPNGAYQWAANATISTPEVCTFHSCTPAAITLTCSTPGASAAAQKKRDITLKKK